MLFRQWAVKAAAGTGENMNMTDHVEQLPGVLPWTAIQVMSHGHEDGFPKDQDRISWFQDSRIACVCDGVSTSPYAAEAAAEVAKNAHYLFDNNHGLGPVQVIAKLSAHLRSCREAAHNKPLSVAVNVPEQMQAIILEQARKKLRYSYQTTIVAAQLNVDDQALLHVNLFQCGDSQLLVFAHDGRLLFPTPSTSSDSLVTEVEIAEFGRVLQFRQRSSVTDVLPDAPLNRIQSEPDLSFENAHSVLLASDGLLDAFVGPHELFAWLMKHRVQLKDPLERQTVMQDLHDCLIDRRGDDDISFVWVTVPGTQS